MMMERLREGSGGLAMKVLLGAIAFSFVFAGVGSMVVSNSGNYAVKVNGKEVSDNEFNRIYQRALQNEQQQLGALFEKLYTPGSLYEQQFKHRVVQSVVSSQLLGQYATNIGLRPSAAQIKERISQMPDFYNDKGQFDNERYQLLLRQNGMTPTEYANSLRSDITNQQLMGQLNGSEFALPFEVTALHRIEQQQRQVRQLTLLASDIKKAITITDAQKKAYYDSHHDQFMKDEKYEIEYLGLTADDIKVTDPITDADIKDYYDKNEQRFITKESRDLGYIIVKGHTDASLKKIQEAKAALANKPFLDVAKTYSEEKISDLGWIQPGVMGDTIDNALASLTKAGYSDIVKTDKDYQIFDVKSFKAGVVQSIEQAKTAIVTELKKQKRLDLFSQQHEVLSETALNSDDLSGPAKMINGEIKSTGLIDLKDLPAILKDPKIVAMLNDAAVKDKKNSPVIDLSDDKSMVIHLKQFQPKVVATFDEVKAEVTTALLQKLTEDALVDKGTKAVAMLDKEGKLPADLTGTFGEAKTLMRSDKEIALANFVFTMKRPKEKATYGHLLLANGDMAIIALDKVIDGTGVVATQDADKYKNTLLQQSSNLEYGSLMRELSSEATVKYQSGLAPTAN